MNRASTASSNNWETASLGIAAKPTRRRCFVRTSHTANKGLKHAEKPCMRFPYACIFFRAAPTHHGTVMGVVANVSLRGFEDGRFLWTRRHSLWVMLVPPLKKNVPFVQLESGQYLDRPAVVGSYTADPGRINSEVKAKQKTPCVTRWAAPGPQKRDNAFNDMGVEWKQLYIFWKPWAQWRASTGCADRTKRILLWRKLRALLLGEAAESERWRLDRLMWRKRRTLRRLAYALHLQEACQAKRSPVSATKSSHLNWLRVFGRESLTESNRKFFANIFQNP